MPLFSFFLSGNEWTLAVVKTPIVQAHALWQPNNKMTLEFKWFIKDSFNEDNQAIPLARHSLAKE